MLLPLLTDPLYMILNVADALNRCANQSYRLMVSVLHSGEMATPSPSQAQLNSYLSCDLAPDDASLAHIPSLYDIKCG